MSQEEKIDVRALAATVLAEVFYCLCFHPGRAPSLKKQYRELAKRLAGIWYQPRDDTYHLERGWRDNLELAGLNSQMLEGLSLELICDPEKFKRAVEQALKAKVERKERIRQKKLAEAIEIRQIKPVVRETTVQSLERMTNKNIFGPKLNDLVRTEDGVVERNESLAPAKQTSVRKTICGPDSWEPNNGLTLHE